MYKKLKEKKNIILVCFLYMFVVAFCAVWYVQSVQLQYTSYTRQQITQSKNELSELVTLISHEGANADVEEIIKDCNLDNRAQFDLQLSNLPKLKGQELVEIEQLFDACGNFYSERKAVMVMRLEQEFEHYKNLVNILALVDSKKEIETYTVEKWGELVLLEKKRSTLSTKLVEIQGDIINKLRQNVNVSSDSLQTMMVDGQKTRSELLTISIQIDQLRAEVLHI